AVALAGDFSNPGSRARVKRQSCEGSAELINCVVNGANVMQMTSQLGVNLVNIAGAFAVSSTSNFTGTLGALGNIELGNASDTTLARASGGQVTIESKPILTVVGVQVFTSGSGTYTPTSGSKFFKVTCTGKGGGGGGSDSDGTGAGAGAGGEAGGTAI